MVCVRRATPYRGGAWLVRVRLHPLHCLCERDRRSARVGVGDAPACNMACVRSQRHNVHGEFEAPTHTSMFASKRPRRARLVCVGSATAASLVDGPRRSQASAAPKDGTADLLLAFCCPCDCYYLLNLPKRTGMNLGDNRTLTPPSYHSNHSSTTFIPLRANPNALSCLFP